MIDASKLEGINQVLKYGMVGGGAGSFIGDVHRKSIAFDGKCKLVAACFSRNFANTLQTGKNLNIDSNRLYKNYSEMAITESQREDGIDFVSIVAQNSVHYDIAKAFLLAGINVACEKPLCFTIEQAKELKTLSEKNNLLFLVTYVYSGYPMVEEARQLVMDGKIGEIKTVVGEYSQDWLMDMAEKTDNRQAQWRTNPQKAGISNCVGDIGSHIENTVNYITGLKIKKLCAKLENIPPSRMLDTNAHIMIEYDNNASGAYWCSQIASGHENDLRVRIYGSKGSLEWIQETPNSLRVSVFGEPIQHYSRGMGYLTDKSKQLTRTPPGHPEAYFEAFSNLYVKFAEALIKKLSGVELANEDLWFTDVTDGYNGVEFINKCVKSSKNGAIWVDVEQI